MKAFDPLFLKNEIVNLANVQRIEKEEVGSERKPVAIIFYKNGDYEYTEESYSEVKTLILKN